MRNPVSFWTFLAFVPALWAHSNLTIAGIVVDKTRAHLPRATGLRRKTSSSYSITTSSSHRPQVSVRPRRDNLGSQTRSGWRHRMSHCKRSSL